MYSVAEVKKAFAAEGLPLTVVWRGRRITDLSPRAWNLVGDFQVSVWPPIKKSGTILVLIQAGHRTVRAGNVDVDYAPTSSKAASIRSAIARLRRTKSR